MKVLGFVSLAWSTGLLLTDQGSKGAVVSDDKLMYIDEECMKRERISNVSPCKSDNLFIFRPEVKPWSD